ncbi:hypothetical protein [Streptomyces misionensis]|uniref:hypothetical protein n=1 Tax=Streptomyces misionensis TaxID=67331 RepID=UPI0021BDAB01|nr:hypothetical protein [Streptomyces misionensis]
MASSDSPGAAQPPPGPLTDLWRARSDCVRRDLDHARAEDLAQLEAAGLILIVERLRGLLTDILELVDDVIAAGEASGR